ncbi:ubiquitinyl hydrolase 1 KNAG_0D05080 [Huiozyma naganishii CBS 8797]|uniref:MINDY deubiquitinase domain-containing protein n=1 Tax=Huiozyma naganishii (strain ATCC MYA-139 / BCRC 22969 / CBS 8797 / KCTC 17520 / NBRC 10181 / NCYC 3082 / Yp74L-3) TaxID=1071383 RepID=J7RYK2_HUIN7|nr:hypothetical protein KNAG_0D05080 [Kazachstania naganishii CBS 8797]CCK70247.1 hypothetical protein KNAG_0D05080 [Kazachstania naganishii CBS 8797]
MSNLVFATKVVTFDRSHHTILLQNENGPCALLALVNVLLLSPKHRKLAKPLIELAEGMKNVPLQEILPVLADISIDNCFNLRGESSGDIKQEEEEEAGEEEGRDDDDDDDDDDEDDDGGSIDQLLLLLPELHTGLNVNPRFDGTFAKTSQETSKVFKLYNVPLVHGWVYNGDEKLSHYSYEEAQDLLTKACDIEHAKDITPIPIDGDNAELLSESAMLKEFLQCSATQLTEDGLRKLHKTLKDDDFCVLFRNDHFSTMYKHDGVLYLLVTDLGFRRHKDIVWEALITISGSDNVFCNDKFIETPLKVMRNDTGIGEEQPEEGIYTGEEFQQRKNDEAFAAQLQSEEDSRMARQMVREQDSGHRQTRSSKRGKPFKQPVKKHTKHTVKIKSDNSTQKKKADCIVM